MRTARTLTVFPSMLCPGGGGGGGGVCSWGVSALGGLLWGVGCLVLGGVSAPWEMGCGGVSALGGPLPGGVCSGGVSTLWGCLLWGVSTLGGVCFGEASRPPPLLTE